MAETAVIVGASGGIGRAVATALAADGYRVVLNARRAEPLEELAAGLPDAAWVAGDGADEEVAERVREQAGDVAVLVHTAGMLVNSPVREQPLKVFEQVLRANLSSVYASARALLPAMRAGSRIVLVSSTSALHPTRGLTAYTAAKAGLNAMAGVLARELEEDGIGVHVVSPGPVDTAMLDADTRRFAVLAPEDVARVISWLVGLPPGVVVPELVVHSPVRGPFATRWYEPRVSSDDGGRTPP